MAGAVGIVFGLCVLSFTLGAALMYVLVRRREDSAPTPADAPLERTWVEKPAAVEPVADDYDTRPIHRNPVVGLPQWEPALASLAAPVAESDADPEAAADAEPDSVVEPSSERAVEPVAEVVPGGAPKPVAEAVVERVVEVKPGRAPKPVAETVVGPVAEAVPGRAPEPVAEAGPEPVEAPETVGAAGYARDGDSAPPVGDLEAPEPTVAAGTDTPELPTPAAPQPVEQTTWVEREDFRRRYLRTFEEVRRKADTN